MAPDFSQNKRQASLQWPTRPCTTMPPCLSDLSSCHPPSLILPQPHCLPCCFWNILRKFPPQCLCTGCSICRKCFFPYILAQLFFHFFKISFHLRKAYFYHLLKCSAPSTLRIPFVPHDFSYNYNKLYDLLSVLAWLFLIRLL